MILFRGTGALRRSCSPGRIIIWNCLLMLLVLMKHWLSGSNEQPVQRVQDVLPVEPVQRSQPVQPVQPVPRGQPVQPVPRDQPVQPVESDECVSVQDGLMAEYFEKFEDVMISPVNSLKKFDLPEEMCLLACTVEPSCMLVVHSGQPGDSSRCRFHRHTPFRWGIVPKPFMGSTVYIHEHLIRPGVKEADKNFYYVSNFEMIVPSAIDYCEVGREQEFYHLAVKHSGNNVLKVVKKYYKKLTLKKKNTRIFFMVLEGARRPKYLSQSKIPGTAEPAPFLAMNFTKHFAYYNGRFRVVRKTSSRTGYALCQGDPLNIARRSEIIRNYDVENDFVDYDRDEMVLAKAKHRL